MKVYMLQDIEHVGFAGQIVKVADGYATNYLLPRKFALRVNKKNESFYSQQTKRVEVAAAALSNKQTMLAERLKNTYLTLKKRVHDDGKLYGSVTAEEIVSLLKNKAVNINKKQVVFAKSIRTEGEHKVAIKLSAKLQPEVNLTVSPEKE